MLRKKIEASSKQQKKGFLISKKKKKGFKVALKKVDSGRNRGGFGPMRCLRVLHSECD